MTRASAPTTGGYWTARKALTEAQRRLGASAAVRTPSFRPRDVESRGRYSIGVVERGVFVCKARGRSWAECFALLDAVKP